MQTHNNTAALKRAFALQRMGRRLFFRHMATPLSGYCFLPSRPGGTVARAAAAPIGTAQNVIFILLTGAPSHTDTFDLKEGPWTPAFFNQIGRASCRERG